MPSQQYSYNINPKPELRIGEGWYRVEANIINYTDTTHTGQQTATQHNNPVVMVTAALPISPSSVPVSGHRKSWRIRDCEKMENGQEHVLMAPDMVW